jgi:hypothetical protein
VDERRLADLIVRATKESIRHGGPLRAVIQDVVEKRRT